MSVDPERRCENCGAGLDGAQRYCLSCGTRAGSPSPQLDELKRRASAPALEPADASPPPAAPSAVAAGPGPRLPTPRISALLVLVFLGFGTLLGSAAGSSRGRMSAEVSPRLKLVVPASTGPAAEKSSGEASGEAPESEPESTPEAAKESSGSKTSAGEEKEEKSEETEEGKEKETKPAAAKPATKLPAFKHVFVVVLGNEPYAALFAPESKAHYIAGTLEKKGELLLRYDAIAHEQLANGVALISGQGPTAQTAANCPSYTPLTPGGQGANGQALGSGCVYPSSTKTVGDQLAAKKLSWRAYVEGIDEPGTAAGPCAHPAPGAADSTLESGAYATFRDPFVYFESVASSSGCATEVVGLSALKGDLASASATPSLAYIVPDRCHDGGPTPCSPGAATGPADADALLEKVIPEITASKGYKNGGLIVITTDEAPSSGEYADSSSCCGQPAYPNLPVVEGHGKGGGTVGALLISPYVTGAKTSAEPYNHFSLLRTIEDIFKVSHLGYAGLSAVKPLAPALFTATAKG